MGFILEDLLINPFMADARQLFALEIVADLLWRLAQLKRLTNRFHQRRRDLCRLTRCTLSLIAEALRMAWMIGLIAFVTRKLTTDCAGRAFHCVCHHGKAHSLRMKRVNLVSFSNGQLAESCHLGT